MTHRQVRRAASAALAVTLVIASAGRLHADEPVPPIAPAMAQMFGNYVHDPERHRLEVIALGRTVADTLPPPLVLLLADANLRSGQMAQARRLLTSLLAKEPGPPWSPWAEFGLGWLALVAGDVAAARPHYTRAAAADPPNQVAEVLLGLLDAVSGRTAEAVDGLEAVAGASGASLQLRQAARLIAAYARYWAGDYDRAAVAFAAAGDVLPSGALFDDALYGTAQSLWRSGDHASALATLQTLAAGQGVGITPRRVTRGLLELQPRSLVRASVKRYRQVPLGRQEDLLVAIIDAEGAALARAALERLEGRPTAELPAATPREAPIPAAMPAEPALGVRPAEPAAAPASRRAADVPRAPTGHRLPWISLVLLAVLAALGVIVAARRRLRPPVAPRPPARRG